MDDIIVIDDFLSHDELVKVTSRSTYKNEDWGLQRSWDGNDTHPLKKIDFNGTFLTKRLDDNEYYTSYLFNKIKNHFNYNYKLIEVYLNGNEALRNGSFHIDDADRTVILYIGDWEPAWGGFTHFMLSDIDHRIVAPITGRMINFRSDIPHKAYAYCYSDCPMRVSAAFKLKL